MEETARRREIQSRYNEEHGIVPKTIVKGIRDVIDLGRKDKDTGKGKRAIPVGDKEKMIEQLTAEMREAARMLEFEKAAYLRDRIKELREKK